MCRYKIKNIPMSSQIIGKNPVFGGYFEFSWQKRKYLFWTYILYWSLLSNLKIGHSNFEIISISSQVIGKKKRFLVAILHFPLETGKRFIERICFTNYYYQTWKFTIRILEIYQLVLKLWTKNRFSVAILNFYDQTGSRIFEPIYFTNHFYRTWKFAFRILKIFQ